MQIELHVKKIIGSRPVMNIDNGDPLGKVHHWISPRNHLSQLFGFITRHHIMPNWIDLRNLNSNVDSFVAVVEIVVSCHVHA